MGSALISAIATLIGVALGYGLSTIPERKRIEKYKSSYYLEIEIIQDDFCKWLVVLLDEFSNPKRKTLSRAPTIDFEHINKLEIALVGELSVEQRKFIKWLKGCCHCVSENYKGKEEVIRYTDNFYYIPSNSSAIAISDVVQIVYCTTKVLEAKEHFTIATNHNYLECSEVSCKVSGIPFNRSEFTKIITSAGLKA